MRRAWAIVAVATALPLASALPRAASAQQPAPNPAPVLRARTAAEDLQLFSQVFNQIRVNHPDSLDSHRLFMAAIQAMVQAADPHSYVIQAARLDPKKEEEFRNGRVYSVPIDWNFVGGSAVVANVRSGTDARRRDILPGDELVAIEGQPMRAESALELEIMLAGPRNSEIALTFERRAPDGSYSRLERKVKRERYDEESSVPAALMLDDSTGYIRIITFGGERTANQLRLAVDRVAGWNARRLVLDLRQNGGGIIDEALGVSSEFLPNGTIVYTSETRRTAPDTGRVRRVMRPHRTWPMVVLVDDGTASASELLAGALQDHDRALIVGRPTFGKSLMMRGFPLSDGSALMLVIGRVRTPCGRLIQREYRGVNAQKYYRMASAERDTVGLPTCKTFGGRTVYGGGGIFPDIRLPRPAAEPEWVRRLEQLDLPMQWAGGYVTANAATLTDLNEFGKSVRFAPGAEAAFRAFATERGVTIPDTPEAERQLARILGSAVAFAKWGLQGLFTVEAYQDPDVRGSLKYFSELSSRGIR